MDWNHFARRGIGIVGNAMNVIVHFNTKGLLKDVYLTKAASLLA